jgi:hypothetical protein
MMKYTNSLTNSSSTSQTSLTAPSTVWRTPADLPDPVACLLNLQTCPSEGELLPHGIDRFGEGKHLHARTW